jgi:hypothetical protein
MNPTNTATPSAVPANSKGLVWTGRVLSTLVVLMMGVMPIVMLTTNRSMMADGLKQYGYPDNVLFPIVIAEIVSALIYAIPQTSMRGAILLTGYLGGAVATHVHAGESTWYIAVIVGVVVWLGLLLRDARLGQLLPLRR